MYSAELIKEVKELYPNSTEMHQLAENGGAFLGRYLDDSSPSGFPIDKILLATSLDEIQKEARKISESFNSPISFIMAGSISDNPMPPIPLKLHPLAKRQEKTYTQQRVLSNKYPLSDIYCQKPTRTVLAPIIQ